MAVPAGLVKSPSPAWEPRLPALAGGTPVRAEFLPLSRPQLGAEEEAAVVEVLRSGWIGTGPRAERFERAFAGEVGTRHAVAVSSCTAGLHLLLRAFGVGPGDEVITSPMTFPATANAILHAGARPVFADVMPDLLTLDPERVAAAIGPRTRAIVAVQFAGWPCRMDDLTAIAEASGVPLIEDAAHALGATYRGRPVGSLGAAAAFSFYASKNITTGEGGMVSTDRDDLVGRMRCERLHGIDVEASQRTGTNYEHWEAVALGFKYNLSDIAAAIGLAQLGKLPQFLARRRALDARYRIAIAPLECLDVVEGPAGAETAAHLFPVLIRRGALRLDRDGLLRALLAENVGIGVHFRALPLHRYFRETLRLNADDFPVSTDASERLLSLPLFPAMSDGDQEDVLEALARIAAFYRT